MDINITTNDNHVVLTPMGNTLDKAYVIALIEQMISNLKQSNTGNCIIDLQHCNKIDETGMNALMDLHESSYKVGYSLIFTNVNAGVMAMLKNKDTEQMLNITPSIEEARDIINMEQIEREFLSEE